MSETDRDSPGDADRPYGIVPTSEKTIELGMGEESMAAHILLDGVAICPRNGDAEAVDLETWPQRGLCGICEHRAPLLGLDPDVVRAEVGPDE